jgi:hypothetical protein
MVARPCHRGMSADPVLSAALRLQARICGEMGSKFYEGFLGVIAEDLDAGGVSAELLAPWIGTGRRAIFNAAVPNRIANAFTWLAMGGEDAGLSDAFPRAPDRPGDPPAAWAAARAALADHRQAIDAFMAHEPQTNEVRRSAVLLAGFLTVAAETGLPLRCFEVGASAGLNLYWDRFHYRLGEAEWGDPASPVEVPTEWAGSLPPLDAPIRVVERAACDRRPTDLADPAQRRRLLANIWPDQFHRLERSGHAIELALAAGIDVEEADAVDWVRARVRVQPGAATVLYHSIFWQYLDAPTLEGLLAAIRALGEQATVEAPFAWLRMEPRLDNLAITELRLTLWPGGEERKLAEVSPHGAWVRSGAPWGENV